MGRHRTCFLLLVMSFILAGLGFLQPTAQAQGWVRDMFTETSHDFGTVPRGAKAEFEFKLKNIYQETVHISSVHSSCGCTTPSIKNQMTDLKTYQEGAIVCEFNTDSFIGLRSAQVTVVFTKPFSGEIQLNVRGNIRSDISAQPGLIEFGEVAQGEAKQAEVKVSYTGREDWKINDVRSLNPHLTAKIEPASGQGRIGYSVSIRLLDTAPPGDFRDQVVLVTNEPNFNLVTVPVSGIIVPPLDMAESLELGTLKVGTTEENRIVVKGNAEFEVTKVICNDQRFAFTIPEGKKKFHIIPVAFKTGDALGAFRELITVHTTLGDEQSATTVISGNIIN